VSPQQSKAPSRIPRTAEPARAAARGPGCEATRLEVGFVAKPTGLANRKYTFVDLPRRVVVNVCRSPASLSSVGVEMAGCATDRSVAALTFLVRFLPLRLSGSR
jgi:hypothetical protein